MQQKHRHRCTAVCGMSDSIYKASYTTVVCTASENIGRVLQGNWTYTAVSHILTSRTPLRVGAVDCLQNRLCVKIYTYICIHVYTYIYTYIRRHGCICICAYITCAIWDHVRVQCRVCKHNTLHFSLHHRFKSEAVTIWAPKIHGGSLQIFCAFKKTSVSVRFFTVRSPSQKDAKKLKKKKKESCYAHSVKIFGSFTQCCLWRRTRFVPLLFVMFFTTNDVLSDVFHNKKKGSFPYRHTCKRQLMQFVHICVYVHMCVYACICILIHVSDNSCSLSLGWSAACSRTP